jgi:high-affinity iron transporter
MLPTFVIGLREGLEAALIVGIVAAFLRRQGRRDLLRWVFVGVGAALLLCATAGIALDVLSKDLPQRRQEGLETVIGALAVGMVTYMVVWMKRNSRGLKGQLEGMAADAMGGSSGAARAMIVMAFLAVLREGVETVVFLLAAFNQSTSGPDAAVGAVLGVLIAVGLGYGIYRGGVRLNLSKFFRATGLVLVLVAAGLVVNALRTAHEAGWLNIGQGRTVDLTWLVAPGSVQSSLLTGMLGLQSRPVVMEVLGWLVYLVPVGLYVAWPPGRSPARRWVSRVLLASGALVGLAAIALAFAAPARPPVRPVTAGARVLSLAHGTAVVRLDGREVTMQRTGDASRGGVDVQVYSAGRAGTAAATLPGALSDERIAALNGGRLPIGLRPGSGGAPVRYADTVTATAWIEPRTARIVGVRTRERVSVAVARPGHGALPLALPIALSSTSLPGADVRAATAAASADRATVERRTVLGALAWTVGILGVLLLMSGTALAVARRQVPVPRDALASARGRSQVRVP